MKHVIVTHLDDIQKAMMPKVILILQIHKQESSDLQGGDEL